MGRPFIQGLQRLLRMLPGLALSLAAGTAAAATTATDEKKDPIADYQADLSGGAVSAGEMLGLTPSAVTTIQTPKDFVAALNMFSSGGDKNSFGLALSPARTRFAPVSIHDYTTSTGSRIWAGTTFSYAQNVNTQAGVDYRQRAAAVRITWYLEPGDDPAIAGYRAFAKCDPVKELAAARADRMIAVRQKLRDEGVPTENLNERAKAILDKEEPFLKTALPAYKSCVDGAIEEAKTKWNASQVALTLGEGRIRGPASGSQELSLGRSASLTVALGPNPDSLVNITVRRTQKAVDPATIAGTPVYKSNSLVGARWTYRAMSAEDLYALAEISNAKASTPGSSKVFKYAVGVDKKLAEGMWIEFRYGRSHKEDGTGEQNLGLLSLKFSPASKLGK